MIVYVQATSSLKYHKRVPKNSRIVTPKSEIAKIEPYRVAGVGHFRSSLELQYIAERQAKDGR